MTYDAAKVAELLAVKIHPSMSVERRMECATLDQRRTHTARLISAELGPLLEQVQRLTAERDAYKSVRREEIERLVSGTQGEKRSSSVVSMLAGMTRDTVDELQAEVERLTAEVERLRQDAERLDYATDNAIVPIYGRRPTTARAASTVGRHGI